MKVVVASKNPVKKEAVLKGFNAYFKDVYVESVSVDSGVSEQPGTDGETFIGARNRVMEARKEINDANYWVAIEGGIQAGEKDLFAFAWVVIYSAGKYGEARSASFVLPEKVAHLVAGGIELGAANDLVFSKVNSKQKDGAVGLLTHNKIDRTELYRHAVIMALIPFINPGLY
jgi:inosine/xanthosine triphosphatase